MVSWGYFNAFHAGMGQENCENIAHESIGNKTVENHEIKPWKSTGSMEFTKMKA